MDGLLVLDEAAVQELLDIEDLLPALSDALIQLSAGTTSVPPRVAAFTPDGLLGAMPGYLPGAGLVVKLVSVFDENARHGLPSHQALIILFDPETGAPRALMDGTYITAIRTAGCAAVAARALAREDSKTLAIIGAGVQGKSHLEVFSSVFELGDIRVASRNPKAARDLASISPIGHALPFEEAVRGADLICCCTNAEDPVTRYEWISPGAHVSSVGRFGEVDQVTMKNGSVFVEFRGAATIPPPAGTVNLDGIDPDTITEIGEVLADTAPGRTSPEQITVYKSVGHAVEDAAAAGLVYRSAVTHNAGVRVGI